MNDRICFYSPPFPKIKSYFDMIDVTMEYGLKYIEGFNVLDFECPDIVAAKKIREYADNNGIGFSCFSVYINLVGDDRREQVEKLKGYADVAKILGSPYLHHTIANDFQNPHNILPNKEKFFQRGLEAVREIYDYCDSLGIKAIYEEQGYLFNGIEGYRRFLDEVGRDVGVLADFANICQAGDKIEDFIEAFSGRIVHAHIKDVFMSSEQGETGLATLTDDFMHPTLVGQGDVDIKKGIEILKNIGYTGWYGLEYGASEDDCVTIDDALKYIDDSIMGD